MYIKVRQDSLATERFRIAEYTLKRETESTSSSIKVDLSIQSKAASMFSATKGFNMVNTNISKTVYRKQGRICLAILGFSIMLYQGIEAVGLKV